MVTSHGHRYFSYLRIVGSRNVVHCWKWSWTGRQGGDRPLAGQADEWRCQLDGSGDARQAEDSATTRVATQVVSKTTDEPSSYLARAIRQRRTRAPPAALKVGHSDGVMPGDLDYRYDRRVEEDFLALFDSNGPFRTLTEYARKARYPVDLQFRLNPKTRAQHASLYVGLTTVLDVH